MSPPKDHESLPAELAMPAADWQPTPFSVQTCVRSLLKRLEVREARLHQDSTTSHRPPSTDSPYQKGRTLSGGPRRKAGGCGTCSRRNKNGVAVDGGTQPQTTGHSPRLKRSVRLLHAA